MSRASDITERARRDGTLGVWLKARTPVDQPYPCWCRGDRACRQACPCRGRADWQQMPAACCARRAGETKQRQESGE